MADVEPTRWADAGGDVPSALRDAVREARIDGPSEFQLARMISRSGGAMPAPSAALPAPSFGGASAMFGVVAVLAAAGALTWFAWHGRAAQREPPAPKLVSQGAAARPPTPALDPQSAERGAEAQPAPRESAPTAARVRNAAPSPKVEAPDAAAEVDLLRRAKRMLESNPLRAQQLLQTHVLRYPRGVFVEEREALAVEALLRLGRPRAAHARAQRLRDRFPESPYLRRIDELLQTTAVRPESPPRE